MTLFVQKHKIPTENIITLENALKKRIFNPHPYSLLLGVVNPLGSRNILAIPQSDETNNTSLETRIFCAKHNITTVEACDGVLERVEARLNHLTFSRKVLLVVPVDAPDSRKLQLILREGEQHDLMQTVSDFLEYYHMDTSSASMLANAVNQRLAAASLTIPVGIANSRKVVARFAESENVTAVIEGFVNVFEVGDDVKLQLLKFARAGMAPGTYVV